jgi:ketosteroid isomerase-like protein
MRTISLVVPLFVFVCQPPNDQVLEEDEVRSAFSEFSRAFQQADVSVLQTLVAKNYVHVNGGSANVLNRDEWLSWIASRRAELDGGVLVIRTYSVEDVNVQIYGETTVVTGVVMSSGERNGVSFNSAVRFTNVWVKQDGVLRRVAFHDSPLPQSEP